MRFFKILLAALKSKPYLLPPIIVLIILAAIAALAGNPVIAPFLYTIF